MNTDLIVSRKLSVDFSFLSFLAYSLWAGLLLIVLVPVSNSMIAILSAFVLFMMSFCVLCNLKLIRISTDLKSFILYANLFLLLFGLVNTPYAVFSTISSLVFKTIFSLSLLVVFFIYLYSFFDAKSIVVLELFCAAILRWVSLFFVFFAICYFYISHGSQLRVSWVSDYNYLSVIFLYGLISWYLKLRGKNKYFPLAASLYTLFALVIFLSGSRRSIICLTLVAGYAIFRFILNKRNLIPYNLISFCCFFIFVMVILTWLNPSSFSSNVYSLLHRYATIDSISKLGSTRFLRMDYALDIIHHWDTSNFLIGDGFNFIYQYGQFFNVESGTYPHNPIISSFLYGGVAGVIFLTLLYAVLAEIIYSTWKALPFFSPVLLISVFFGFFSGATFISDKLFCYSFVVVFVFYLKNKRKYEGVEKNGRLQFPDQIL